MGSSCACAQKEARLNEILQKNAGKSDLLINVLHQTQQLYGYLPADVLWRVATALNVPISRVSGVVSFYSFFTTKPKGRHQISVCKGTACYVKGAGEILQNLEEKFHLKPGDTSDDGRFSLEVVRCVGACGLGPVVLVDEDVYARVNPARMDEVLAKYK